MVWFGCGRWCVAAVVLMCLYCFGWLWFGWAVVCFDVFGLVLFLVGFVCCVAFVVFWFGCGLICFVWFGSLLVGFVLFRFVGVLFVFGLVWCLSVL